jgi:hypothetical protein
LLIEWLARETGTAHEHKPQFPYRLKLAWVKRVGFLTQAQFIN